MTKQDWRHQLSKHTEKGWSGCEAPEGWKDLIMETHAKLLVIDRRYRILQIKEKYGGLRYYFEVNHYGIKREIMEDITTQAEWRSGFICIDCGGYARPTVGKYYVWCEEHDRSKE